jgi:hypothetical protein
VTSSLIARPPAACGRSSSPPGPGDRRSIRLQDRGHAELVVLGLGGVGHDLLGGQRLGDGVVVAEDVLQRVGVRRRRHVVGRDLADLVGVGEDALQLRCERPDLVVGQGQLGQPRDVPDVVVGERHGDLLRRGRGSR